jgi:hypothetical protein
VLCTNWHLRARKRDYGGRTEPRQGRPARHEARYTTYYTIEREPLVGTIANWVLLASLVWGVLSTFVIVKTADVKEEHWAEDRRHSSERAGLDAETSWNLSFQFTMLLMSENAIAPSSSTGPSRACP